MDQGRSRSQNRLTSTGGPTRASCPGVFPFVSGHRVGTSRPGGGHRARLRPHSSQQEEKERRPGEEGQLAGRESRAPALGTGEPPPSPPGLRVRGVGWGKGPRGLRALSKMRPLLRARSCPKWGEGCSGRRRGPDTEWRAWGSRAAGPPGVFTFCHKGGVICISEVIDISASNLDSSLCFFQPSISFFFFFYF